MNTHADKTQENKRQSVASPVSQKKISNESAFQFVDNRPEAIQMRKLQEMANNSSKVSQLRALQDMADNSPQARQAAQLQAMADNHSAQQLPIQKKENNTGLPDALKSGIENLSGYSMDDVKVHPKSDKPAQLQAHAYAQGTDIHLGPGQEKHLPHEAWHVVQQKQGRVKPTMQMKGGVNVNDDKGLEKEADVMALKALEVNNGNNSNVHQLVKNIAITNFNLPFQLRKGDYDDGVDNSGEYAKKQAEGLQLPSATLTLALNKKKWRKVNRITGALFKKTYIISKTIPGVISWLLPLIQILAKQPAKAEEMAAFNEDVNKRCDDLIRFIVAGLKKVEDQDLTWLQFDTVSMLGPLAHWLDEGLDLGLQGEINSSIKKLRHKQALRDGLSVVAHRGSGPTNRTRGGLIQQDDPRRTRPAENSKEAFGAAYEETTRHEKQGEGLDGVECDVFLSSDSIPILSHEGAVLEQLSTAQQASHPDLDAHTHVEDLNAEQITGIQRTGSPRSGFLSLADFLNSTIKIAAAYYAQTEKPFRVEIEMKGKPEEMDDPTEGTLKDSATYKETLTYTVAKAISQFKKANTDLPIEIIIFNNYPDDAKSYAGVREAKSRLGDLYTGLGSHDADLGRKSDVDELRMGASTANARLITNRGYSDFILTLVPGAEIALSEAEARYNPFKPLIFTPDPETLTQSITELEEEVRDRGKALSRVQRERTQKLTQEKDNIKNSLRSLKKEKGKLGAKHKGIPPDESPDRVRYAEILRDEDKYNKRIETIELSINDILTGLEGEQKHIHELIERIKNQRKQLAYIEKVNRDMETYGQSDTAAINEIISQINRSHARNVHLLTDNPKNAALYKSTLTVKNEI